MIALLREPEPVSGAWPDDVIQRGDTLVTVGKSSRRAGEGRESRYRLTPAPFAATALWMAALGAE